MARDREGEGMVRCKNCIQRFKVEPPGVEEATCPHCGIEYIISWPKPDMPYIRRPKHEAE
jgi:hypothetical protein